MTSRFSLKISLSLLLIIFLFSIPVAAQNWPDPPNVYSWDGSWLPANLPPPGLYDDVYYDGHLVYGEPSPILPPGEWDYAGIHLLANWRGFRDYLGTFDRLEDEQGGHYGWRFVAVNPQGTDGQAGMVNFHGSSGCDILDLGPEGSFHSAGNPDFGPEMRLGDGPDMLRYSYGWSAAFRTGSDATGNNQDDDLVIIGTDDDLPGGEYDIITTSIHTGPGNDLVFVRNWERAGIDLGNGGNGRTDTIDPTDGDDVGVIGGNARDFRAGGGYGNDTFYWYVDEVNQNTAWLGPNFFGAGSWDGALWTDPGIDRLVLVIPTNTPVTTSSQQGAVAILGGSYQVVVDQPSVYSVYGRYYVTAPVGPNGEMTVTLHYISASGHVDTGHFYLTAFEELQIGIGSGATVYDIDPINRTLTANPGKDPYDPPLRAEYNALFDDFPQNTSGPGQIYLGGNQFSVDEDAGTIAIPVVRNLGSDGFASIQYATSNGTADNADYGSTSGTLSWNDGEFGEQTFTIPIVQDTDQEGTETVQITLSNAVGAALGTPSTAILDIIDDDIQQMQVRVNASDDDAEETVTSGTVNLVSSDLELSRDGASNQLIGMRFNQLPIPRGSTILSAAIQFQVDEATTEATSLMLHGQAVDNAPSFTPTVDDLSTRSLTASSVAWNPPAWNQIGQAGPEQRTPDLSSIVQEIVNRSGWQSGNSMVFFVSGSGQRVAESYNGSPGGAPLLMIQYAPATGGGATFTTLPMQALQGQSLTLQVTGTNTHFQDGTGTSSVQLVNGPTTLNGTNLSVANNTALSADFSIPLTAPAGLWDVVVTTETDGVLTAGNAFQLDLAPPTGLTLDPVSLSQIELNWTNHSQTQTHVRIERSTAGGPFQQIAQISGTLTTFTDDNLSLDVEYCYRVRAFDGTIASAPTPQTCVTIPTPIVPEIAAITPNSVEQGNILQVTITGLNTHFQDGAGTSSVQLAHNGTVIAGSSVNVTSNTELTAIFDVPISSPVAARDVIVTTEIDGAITGAALFDVLLGSPTSLIVNAFSSTQIDLQWTNRSGTQTRSVIERRLGQNGQFVAVAQVGQFVDAYSDMNLNPNTQYCYRVRAIDATGHTSDFTNVNCATTAPGASAILTALDPGSAAQDVTIAIAITGENSHFQSGTNAVYLQNNGAQIDATNIAVTDDTHLSADVTIPMTAATGLWDVVVETVTDGAITFLEGFQVTPGAPDNLSASALSQSAIQLTWTNHSATQTGVEIERSEAGGNFVQIAMTDPAAEQYLDDNLQADTDYCYRIRGLHANEPPTPFTDSVCDTTTILDTIILSVSPTEAMQGQNVAVTIVGQNTHFGEGLNAPQVALYRDMNTGILAYPVDVVSNTHLVAHFNIPSDQPTGLWNVGVRTELDQANPEVATVEDGFSIFLAPPANLVASGVEGYTKIALSWSNHSETQTAVHIERRSEEESEFSEIATVGPNATSFLDFNVTPGVEYCYRIRGYDGIEFSAFSNSDCATPAVDGTPLWNEIVSLDASQFPLIYAHVNVFSYGTPLLDLTADNFMAFEDGVQQTGLFDVTPPSQNDGQRIVDIVFVMDNSGSMAGEQQQVADNLSDFIDDLVAEGVDFRLGLVRYGQVAAYGCPIVEDNGNLTADVAYFRDDVWQRNVTQSGGPIEEPSFAACAAAVQEMNYRPGARKIVILITDEDNYPELCDGHKTTREECVSIANSANATIFALINESEGNSHYDYVGPGSITEATNGQSYAVTAPFDQILMDIGDTVSSSYVVRYQSGNPNENGQERHVKIKVLANGDQSYDDAWYTPGSEPNITLLPETTNLHTVPQPPSVPILVSVDVEDWLAPFLEQVLLFYRQIGQLQFNIVVMNQTMRTETYSGQIPGNEVQYPGIEYYVRASDGQNVTTLPSTDPNAQPFTIAIDPNAPPIVTHTPITYAELNEPLTIGAVVTDDTDFADSVTLFYRPVGALLYTELPMSNTGSDDYSATIPANEVDTNLEYFIRAEDNFGIVGMSGSTDSPHLILTDITTIDGYVYYDDGTRAIIPLPNIVVQAWDSYPDGGIVAVDTTDAAGFYQLLNLTQGMSYDLRAYSLEPYDYFPEVAQDVVAPAEDVELFPQPTPAIVPNNQIGTFYCTGGTLFEGYPLQDGDVITAYDPQGTICGKSYLSGDGQYSIYVYGDDTTTDGVKEGPVNGETVTFRINQMATQVLSGDPTWYHLGLEEVCLSSTPLETVTIPLVTGWNLISWHVDTVNDSTPVVFGEVMDNVTAILSFDNGALSYRPDFPPQFSNLWQADHMHGYWLRMIQPDTLHVTGMPVPPQTPFYLDAGWQLLSYLPPAPDSTQHAIASVLDYTVAVLGFDQGALTFRPDLPPAFSNLKVMRPGMGFWFNVNTADTLIYPDTQLPVPLNLTARFDAAQSHTKAASASHRTNGQNLANPSSREDCFMPNVTPTNQWMEIYGQDLTVNGELLPVGSILMAIDADSVVCGAYEVEVAGQFGLMPVYADDAFTDEDEGVTPGESFELYICNEALGWDFYLDEEIVWTGFGDLYEVHFDVLATDDGLNNLPTHFALSQNYPNPFNPNTTIRYALPSKQAVALRIYNTAGQLVRTLVDEQQDAGFKHVEWDGRNDRGTAVSSGIYFYRLEAGDQFVDQKRMILLK